MYSESFGQIATFGGAIALLLLVLKNKYGFVVGALLQGLSLFQFFGYSSGMIYDNGGSSMLLQYVGVNVIMLGINIWGYISWGRAEKLNQPHA